MEAKFESKCAACGVVYPIGTAIAKNVQGQYTHVQCPETRPAGPGWHEQHNAACGANGELLAVWSNGEWREPPADRQLALVNGRWMLSDVELA